MTRAGVLAVASALLGCGQGGTTWIGTQLESGSGGAGAPATDCTPVGPGDACTSLPQRRLPPLSVQGEQLLQSGSAYHLYAISRSDLLWGELNRSGCEGEGHFQDADLDAIAAWNFNTVRLGLSTARWFGRTCAGDDYQARVDHAVAMANAHGLYALLELHWTDVGGLAPCGADCAIGLQPMPDAGAVDFWQQVAARYADNPGVLFDVYNEPGLGNDDAAWACWRDGGCEVTAGTDGSVTYSAAGMQQLFDAVRGAAPQSVIVVAGADTATDLSGVARGFALGGSGIVYAAHMYQGRGYGMAEWQARFGSLAASFPLLVTELGSFDCSAGATLPLLAYLDQPLADPALRIGWGVRSWNVPGDCGYPSIIADFSGAPLGELGQAVRDHLQSYGSSAGPVPP